MMTNSNLVGPQITSLTDIHTCKSNVLREIRDEEIKISGLWKSLTNVPSAASQATPTKRLSSLMSMGAGIVDGVILGWKLYRKYKGYKGMAKPLFRSGRR